MGNKITQEIGFEATKAIAEINLLQTSLAGLNNTLSTFNRRINSGGGGTSKVIQGFAQVQTSAVAADKSVAQLGKQTAKLGKKGKSDIDKVTLAWTGLAKAMIARTTVQAITTVIGKINEATKTAHDFQIEVAQIANIARGAGSSIDELSTSLEGVAVATGRDFAEVTGAAFEALQNDLGTTQQTLDLLTGAANNLALITGGNLTQAVNSISSVMKAWNLNISEANLIADDFFTAIDKGRISLEEFQSSLGRVAPLAANLGISFKETAGAIAAITQAGTTARVSQTQLRNVLQKMIKPTEALQKAFEELGVSSGRELIEMSGGLVPALQELTTVAELGSSEFAGFFGTIRGNLGVLNLLANEAKIVTGTLEEMQNNFNRAAEAAKKIDATDARKYDKVAQKLNVTLKDLGDHFLKAKIQSANIFNLLVSGSGEAEAALLTLTSATVGATIAMKFFGQTSKTTLIFAGEFLILAAAAAKLGTSIGTLIKRNNELEKSVDAVIKSEEALWDTITNNRIEAASNAIEKHTKEMIRSFHKLSLEVSKDYDRIIKAGENMDKIIKSNMDSVVESFSSGIQEMVNSADQLKDIEDALSDLQQGTESAKAKLAGTRFKASLRGMNDYWKAIKTAEQAARALSKQQKAAFNTKATEAGVKSYETISKAAIKAAEASLSAAESTGNRVLIKRAEDALIRVQERNIKNREKLEKKFQSVKEKLESKEFQRLQNQVKNLTDFAKARFKDVLPGTPEAEKSAAEVQAAYDKINFLGAMDGLADELIAALQQGLSDVNAQSKAARKSLQAELDSKPLSARIDIALGATGSSEIDKLIADVTQKEPNRSKASKEILSQLGEREDALNSQRAILDNVNRDLENQDKRWNTLSGAIGKYQVAIAEAKAEFGNLGNNTSEFDETFSQISEVQNQLSQDTSENLQDSVRKLVEARDAAQKLQEAGKFSTKEFNGLNTAIGIISDNIKSIRVKSLINVDPAMEDAIRRVQEKMLAIANSGNTTATATGLILQNESATVSPAASVASSMERQAKAAERIKAAKSGGGGSTPKQYFGGALHRAAGGPTRGLDTQLVAMNQDEFVMNARSSRRFRPQLQAMNAGQTPQYRDQGGPVTNIGDINVNMSSDTASAGQTGRSIASELRRELRRKTSRL